MKTDTSDNAIQPLTDQEIIHRQSQEIEYLKERVNLLLAQIYGKKSEKYSIPDPNQLSFLDEPIDEPAVAPRAEEVSVPAHARKKRGRKPLPEHLPRVDQLHDLSDEEKQCECGSTMTRIGEEVSKQLNYVPAKLEVIRHIRPKYTCKTCEGVESKGSTVRIAPVPKQILEKSIASAGLLAQIITAKFVDALPFYRQEKQFARLGYELSRTNMANWTIQLGQKVKKLLDLLRQDILSGPLINMDETTIQVLKEKGRAPGSKSYMWVMCGGAPKNPGVFFHYSPTRASNVAISLLGSYKGIVQTDGYAGYDYLDHSPDVQHAGCWAHSRRKFMDVLKAKGKYSKEKAKMGHAEQAIDLIRQLYAVERKANADKELSFSERVAKRIEISKPVLEQFFQWLPQISAKTPPKGLLGKAVGYTLERREQLTLFVNHGFLPLDNNLAENAIRPFVIGRKNWLFCDTVDGAKASAALYSLIETAKANRLNPNDYLNMLFNKLPFAETNDQLKLLLPQYHVPTLPG
jgi:transposase